MFVAEFAGQPRFDLLQLGARLFEGFLQAADFAAHLRRRNIEVVELMPPAFVEAEHAADGDAGRGPDAAQSEVARARRRHPKAPLRISAPPVPPARLPRALHLRRPP